MSGNMDSWGVQDTGFYRPPIEEIKETYIALAKEIFGDDIDTDDYTVFGMILRLLSQVDSKQLERDEKLYYSMFPHTATGISLERHCDGVDLHKDGAGYAEHTLRIFGTQNYIIEAGTELKNESGVEFYTVETVAINQPETEEAETRYYADVDVQCKVSGIIGNVNDINSTVEVNTNIQEITYLKTVAYGTEAESDPELRAKYYSVAQGLGTSTRDAIIASVLKVKGVNDADIIDNNTLEDVVVSDTLTLETGTYGVIVYSDNMANDTEIATAIFKKQTLGVPQSGTKEAIVTDSSNVQHTVKFTYVEPNELDIVVACEVDSSFTSNGIQEIKDNLTGYINGLDIGEEVVYTNLFHYIYKVTGVKKVTNLTLNGEKNDIAISKIEVAKVGNISVTVTEV